jgi:hypothetical protein
MARPRRAIKFKLLYFFIYFLCMSKEKLSMYEQYVVNLLRNFTEKIELEKEKTVVVIKWFLRFPDERTADEFLIKAGEYYRNTYG